MRLLCLTASVWVAAGLLHPLLSLAADTLEPSPGESIAAFITADLARESEVSTTQEDSNPGVLSNDPAGTNDTAELIGRRRHIWKAPRESPLEERKTVLYQASKGKLLASYNSTGGGYNITFPGNYAADTSMGDWESPSGEVVRNATLAQMWQKLKLPRSMLANYTESRVLTAFDQYDALLSTAICDVAQGPERKILDDESVAKYRFDHKASSGFFTTTIIACTGSWGITVNGIYWAIDHHGWTSNITLWQQAEIIAATATLDLLFLRIMSKLQEQKYMSHVEAFILNVFIIIGEKLASGVGLAWGGVCTTSSNVRKGMVAWGEGVRQTGVSFMVNGNGNGNANGMGRGGSSTVNLVNGGGGGGVGGGRSSGDLTCTP